MKSSQFFARKCSVSGVGMNNGWYFENHDFYASTKEIALAKAIELGYKSLDEAYNENDCYYTEWEDEEDLDFVLIDNVLLEIDTITLDQMNDCLSRYNQLNNLHQFLLSLALKREYGIKLSHTQCQWTEKGLEKARKELVN